VLNIYQDLPDIEINAEDKKSCIFK
jgi:hypothetical protein